jgi:hypothetical protein
VKPLSELNMEMKALVTATLLFLGLAVLVALTYLEFVHIGSNGSPLLTIHDFAVTYYGPGVGYVTLLALAHIHMMGLVPVFFMIGYIFVHSSFSPRWKATLAVLPFCAFAVDVSGWFLTTLNYDCVYVVLFGGAIFVLSLAAMILLSLYDVWVTPMRRT